MHYVDILIFALIALFLGLRLRSILGSRTGNERPPFDPYSAPPQGQSEPVPQQDKVVRFPGASEPMATSQEAPPEPPPAPVIDFTAYGTAGLGLEAIHKADAKFDPAIFVKGAKAAFEMIVSAFAANDAKTLKGLLAPHVFQDFKGVIDQRQKDGQVLEFQLVGVTGCTIENARLDGHEAYVGVRFISEQAIMER